MGYQNDAPSTLKRLLKTTQSFNILPPTIVWTTIPPSSWVIGQVEHLVITVTGTH